jgi:hypothetical protein
MASGSIDEDVVPIMATIAISRRPAAIRLDAAAGVRPHR